MTDKEKAIVMAYTGICMLVDDKFQIFHKYVEDIMGRHVHTIEMGMESVANEIKEKSRNDFLKLCAENQELGCKITTDQLNQIRGWLVERIFRDPDIMLSDSRFIEVYGDPVEHEEIDMAEVIASLYEVLHREVTGEPYSYFSTMQISAARG